MTNKEIVYNTSNDFLKKLQLLYEEDGMMRNMYKLFKKNIDAFSPSELFLLSIIQDEYQKLYDQYYMLRNVYETEGFDRILSDKYVVEMEKSAQTHPLIITYLHFIRADKRYFTKDYNGAIKDYEEAYSKIIAEKTSKTLSLIDKERCSYLLNSIAWAYKLWDPKNGNNKAIEIYCTMFNTFKDVDRYFFAWRYRRNYGVCLENANRYTEAIEQYEKAIELPDTVNEYKLYLTYCSAVMKYWDKETGKVSGEWIKQARKQYNKTDELFSTAAFKGIENKLKLASEKMRSKDLDSMLPDYYNQRTKMLTYKMILAKDKTYTNKYKDEIKMNLRILEAVSPNALGRHYISRDYYYALYELSHDAETKKECYKKAWEENELLNGKGDAKMFTETIKKKKQTKMNKKV